MHKRLSPKAADFVSKAGSALGIAAGVAAYFGIAGPIKWGFGIGALAAAFWSWRRKLPTTSEIALCVSIALAVAFGIAWYQGRSNDDSYDFIVTPYKKDFATESWFPGPEHEAFDTELHSYGEHVLVECIAENEYGELWYGLPNGNYIRTDDLSPSPRTEGDPPDCD